jgi:hypothetical protein
MIFGTSQRGLRRHERRLILSIRELPAAFFRECVLDLSLVLGEDRAPTSVYVQVPGAGKSVHY